MKLVNQALFETGIKINMPGNEIDGNINQKGGLIVRLPL
jgi:hypothetical protein